MAAGRAAKAIAKKLLEQRELLWPDAEACLWDRTANRGFTTIPKTLPLILQIMDDLSNKVRVSPTYLGLWCATWDNSMVTISKPEEMAHAAGFRGQRAVYTWTTRLKQLNALKFIDIQPGAGSDVRHVLVWNPHRVVRWHHENKTPGLVQANFNALLERALELGARDMLDAGPTFPPVAAAVAA